MSERLNKTSICSVVFLDIVNQSKKPVLDQIRGKETFNGFINEAIRDVAQNDRILVDTGDGAAIALLGAPEEALFVAMTIRDRIVKYNKDEESPLFVRIGINLGPVRVVSDINDRPNILGDGINVAERIMSFAKPNQILVSRSYYEITSRLTDEITGLFSYHGVRQDKHVREHEVYAIRSAEEEPFVPESAGPVATAKRVSVASLLARTLNHDNTARYGLWGSIVLGVMAISAGALALASTVIGPDLADVVTAAQMPEVPLATVPATSSAANPSITPNPAEIKTVAPVFATTGVPAIEKETIGQPLTTVAKTDTHAKVLKHKPAAPRKEQELSAESSVASVVDPHIEVQPTEEERSVTSQGEFRPHWDAFIKSFRQGRKERACSQAEIALHQCS